MPALGRRRDPGADQEAWIIHFDDIRVGTIARRAGGLGLLASSSSHSAPGRTFSARPKCEAGCIAARSQSARL